ncbi:MAG TPA: YCF48-related protein, partial [Planctomycetia bacterium]|nr:YCF48-related protein [Planctomycetia bacterium]
ATVRDTASNGSRTFVVGDRSQVAFTEDAGVTWQTPKLPIPDSLRNNIDFHAVATNGEKVWIAGRPGSIVLHSPDGGATWTTQKTGTTLPIADMAFPTEKRGFAVGAMGLIMATEDGGETWSPRWDPKEGRRAAILFLTADMRTTPLSAVARYGGEQGYHTVAVGIAGPDLTTEPDSAALRSDRWEDAFRAAGGVRAETRTSFPLARDQFDEPTAGILARWNQKLEGNAPRELIRDLAMAIRMYRPSVVVCDPIPGEGEDGGVRGLVHRAVHKAMAAAAGETYPELEAFLALPAHRPNRVFAIASGMEPRAIRHSASDISAAFERSYGEVAEQAAALAHDKVPPTEISAGFVPLEKDAELGADLMTGLGIRHSSNARRPNAKRAELAADVEKMLERRRNLMAMATNDQGILKPEQYVGAMQSAIKGLRPEPAAQAVFRFGRQFVETGRWDLARDCFEFLVQKYPEQPLALEAFRWLTAFRASGEARMRLGGDGAIGGAEMRMEEQGAKVAAGGAGIRAKGQAAAWNRAALDYARGYQALSKSAWSDGAYQLTLAAATRGAGLAEASRIHLDNAIGTDVKSRWARVVGQERFLLNGDAKAVPPLFAFASAVAGRPKLDGELDENMWSGEKPLRLKSAEGERDASYGTDVMIRHNGEYLLIAARCAYPDASHQKPLVEKEKRTRDANLGANDRIEILIDVDRDYTTYFRLQLDQTGQTAEDCWGDKTWNPQWFVATQADDKGWRTEIAIPLAELTPEPRQAAEGTWAMNIQRLIPGKAPQGIMLPAGNEPRPEGFVPFKLGAPGPVAN